MKKKALLNCLPLLVMIGLLTSCEEDHNIILRHRFDEMVVNEWVERIVIVSNQRYVEIHIDLNKALNEDFPAELQKAEVYRLMNQEKQYFIGYYQALLEEHEIEDAPGLEFEDRNSIGEVIESYAWLAFLVLGGLGAIVIIAIQRSKIKTLQDRVSELEEEMRYEK